VARLGRWPSPLGTNFEREILIHSAAHDAKLAPRIAYSKQASQILVTDYVDRADTLPADTNALASLLRRIHTIESTATDTHDEPLSLPVRIAEFVDLLPSDHWLQQVLVEYSESLGALCKAATGVAGPEQTLCHNDLLLANRRWDRQLLAIDWEYACKGDPMFDIAVCVSELSPAQRIAMLRSYFEREPSAAELEKITIYEQLYAVLAALWAAVYTPHLINSPSASLVAALRTGERYR
jgi:thiamine kinase-like enzyme